VVAGLLLLRKDMAFWFAFGLFNPGVFTDLPSQELIIEGMIVLSLGLIPFTLHYFCSLILIS
jgi:hypothetical protein